MTATSSESTALAMRPESIGADRIDLVKRTICQGSTDDELKLFIEAANRLKLDPFARQIFAVKRWDKKQGREVMAIQVSIDGFRLVAERTGKYAGQLGPFWTGDGKEWVEVWLDKDPPRAAKVAVLRSDFKEPLWGVATWEQYKQEGREGLSPMWRKMGPLMLAKCAESLALRRAFPNELSGVYTQEEMAQAATAEPAEPEYTPPERGAEHPKAPTARTGAPGAESTQQATTPTTSGPTPTNGQQQPAASTPGTPEKTPRAKAANTIKHDGRRATHAQVALLHALRSKLGIADCKGPEVCAEDYEEWQKTAGPKGAGGMVKKTRWCVYHNQLLAFRDPDGNRIQTSKDLSPAQISNLIERYDAQVAKHTKATQEIRATAGGPTIDMADLAASMASKGIPEDDLCGFFGKDSITKLDRTEAAHALALVLAWETEDWERVRDGVRAQIEVRQ